MSLEDFESHINDPAPGFRCHAAGDKLERLRFLARVENILSGPGSADELSEIADFSGPPWMTLTRFVEEHDGIKLYHDTKSDAAGLEIYPTYDWRSRTLEMRESMTAIFFDAPDTPNWISDGIAIGEIPQSANYFVLQLDGADSGKIFYANHDDFTTEPIADSFEQFLQMIIGNPPGFMLARGCYTRYLDGETDTQWIPVEYIANCDELQLR